MCAHRFFFQALDPEAFEDEPELLFSLSSLLALPDEAVDSELPNSDDCDVVGEEAGVVEGTEGLLAAFAGAALRAAFLGAAFLGADFFAAFLGDDFFTAFLGDFFAAFFADFFAPFFAAFFAVFLPAFFADFLAAFFAFFAIAYFWFKGLIRLVLKFPC